MELSDKEEQDIMAFLSKLSKARTAITDVHGMKKPASNVNGSMECPVCKKGILYYSISSYNGHINGKCNLGCVSWME